MDRVWLDGEVVRAREAKVSALDRTLLLGVGLFETVRLHGGLAFAFERHLARLRASLSALGLPEPRRLDALQDVFTRLAVVNDVPHAIARVTCTAGDGRGRGSLLVHLRALPDVASPVRVGVAAFAHDDRSPLAGLKTTSYVEHDALRRRAREAGRHDDLCVDQAGLVREATAANLFIVRDGALITPPPDGLLPGVTRSVVLELARDLGLDWRVRPVRRVELVDVDEAFLTNAATGPLAVDELDGHALGADRPIGRALATAYRVRVIRECGVWGGS